MELPAPVINRPRPSRPEAPATCKLCTRPVVDRRAYFHGWTFHPECAKQAGLVPVRRPGGIAGPGLNEPTIPEWRDAAKLNRIADELREVAREHAASVGEADKGTRSAVEGRVATLAWALVEIQEVVKGWEG